MADAIGMLRLTESILSRLLARPYFPNEHRSGRSKRDEIVFPGQNRNGERQNNFPRDLIPWRGVKRSSTFVTGRGKKGRKMSETFLSSPFSQQRLTSKSFSLYSGPLSIVYRFLGNEDAFAILRPFFCARPVQFSPSHSKFPTGWNLGRVTLTVWG